MTLQSSRSAGADSLSFPAGFLWGAATASYQIEGAVAEDGRTPSIWDTFTRLPGAIAGGDTGDVACDHYHRMPEDVALMARLGLGSYRFSVAWPRVRPDAGPVNPAGLAFYERLVDTLLEHHIAPWLTLYHWDLPQALEDRGGWTDRDTAYRFAEYAASVYAVLGDRVPVWTTLNEPWCSAFLGYSAGVHAPGRQEGGAGLVAAHHLLLGHGLVVDALRGRDDVRWGISLNLTVADAVSDDPVDQDAARRIDGLHNRLFLDPILRGSYPADVLADTESLGWQQVIHDGDLALIAAPIDVLGVNYYHGDAVTGRPGATPTDPSHGEHGAAPRVGASPFPTAEHVSFPRRGLPLTDMGWEVQAEGLHRLLTRLKDDYAPPPVYLTETGAAYADVVEDGTVHDADRIAFMDDHLREIHRAIEDGVEVGGLFWWSLLDNFEWAYGYAKRFGLVHVDYQTQRRTLKASALRYADLAASGTLRSSVPAQRGQGQPTLDEVARIAGVSRATASRAVNGGRRVSAGAQAAVDQAVRTLGYVPNLAARSLVTRRTDSVAVIVPEPDDRVFSDPFFAGTLRGVNRVLSARDLQLVLLLAKPGAEKARTLRYLSQRHVDGAVVVSFHRDDGLPSHLTDLGLPFVFVGRPWTGADQATYVDVDNVVGSRDVTQVLVDRGCRRIGVIAGPPDMTAAVDRLQGWREALTRAELAADAVAFGDFTETSGERAATALLDRHPDLDGLAVASDLMAAGALRVIAGTGRRVPDDIAVVGYDDLGVAERTSPSLTTVRQPILEMADRATRLLLEQVDGGPGTRAMRVMISPSLVRRDSA